MSHMPVSRHNCAQGNEAVLLAMRNMWIQMFCCKYQVWFPGPYRKACCIEKQANIESHDSRNIKEIVCSAKFNHCESKELREVVIDMSRIVSIDMYCMCTVLI